MNRPLLRTIVAGGAVAALASCGGGDGPTGPEPGAGVSLELAPGALLLIPGTSQRVTVYQVDAGGRRTAVDATIESSNPSVASVSGTQATGNATGSAMLKARAGLLESEPVLAIVARPAAGALLVADTQVVGPPEPVDAAARYGPGWRYRIHVSGVEPSAGQIMLASGGALVAGRVVSVAPEGSGRLVTLELRPLGELFQELSVSGSLPLRAPAASQSQSVTTLHPSHVRAATANQVETEFELGSFACKASAGVSVSNFTLVSGPLAVTPAMALEFAATNNGLQRLAVTGSITAAQKVHPRFNGVLTGDVDCHAILFAIPFPVSGPLGWFIAGKLPIGAGFTLKAEVTTALMGADLDLHGQATATIGIDCTIVCHPVGDFATSTTGTTLQPVLPDLGTSFHAKLAGTAYVYTEFGIGNPIIESFYIDLIEAKGGVTQSFDLATQEFQAADPQYASSFELTPIVSIGTTARIGEAAEVLGFELPPLTYEPELDAIAHSPVGTLVITPATVRAGDGSALGERATFTVTMDSVNYLGAYAIEAVEIRWKKTGSNSAITLDPGRPGCTELAAAADQRVFTCATDFLESQVGAQTFFAFVKARIFGVPLAVPLEVATNGAATVQVAALNGGGTVITDDFFWRLEAVAHDTESPIGQHEDIKANTPGATSLSGTVHSTGVTNNLTNQATMTAAISLVSGSAGGELILTGTSSGSAQPYAWYSGGGRWLFTVANGNVSWDLTASCHADATVAPSDAHVGVRLAPAQGGSQPVFDGVRLCSVHDHNVPDRMANSVHQTGTLTPGTYEFDVDEAAQSIPPDGSVTTGQQFRLVIRP